MPRSRSTSGQVWSVMRTLTVCGTTRSNPRETSVAGLLFDGLDKALDVAVGEGASAVTPGRVLERLRHVVVDEEAVEADFEIGLHRAVHVHVARIHELLVKLRHHAGHIPEVDVQDLVARAEVADLFVDVDIVRHFRECSLTELNPIRVAWT